jgi:hypothetical protein
MLLRLMLNRWDGVADAIVGVVLFSVLLLSLFIWAISRLLKNDADAKQEGRMGLGICLVLALIGALKLLVG